MEGVRERSGEVKKKGKVQQDTKSNKSMTRPHYS